MNSSSTYGFDHVHGVELAGLGDVCIRRPFSSSKKLWYRFLFLLILEHLHAQSAICSFTIWITFFQWGLIFPGPLCSLRSFTRSLSPGWKTTPFIFWWSFLSSGTWLMSIPIYNAMCFCQSLVPLLDMSYAWLHPPPTLSQIINQPVNRDGRQTLSSEFSSCGAVLMLWTTTLDFYSWDETVWMILSKSWMLQVAGLHDRVMLYFFWFTTTYGYTCILWILNNPLPPIQYPL